MRIRPVYSLARKAVRVRAISAAGEAADHTFVAGTATAYLIIDIGNATDRPMALFTLFVSIVHAFIAAFNFRNGFFLYVFLYATYPRLFSIGIGSEGFALSAQRLTMITMVLLFIIRFLYGSADVKRGFSNAFANWRTMLCLVAILGARLLGNYVTGRIDLTVVASFVDESLTILFAVFLCLMCLKTRRDVYLLLLVIAASLIPNQLAVVIETLTQQSIYPGSLQVDFETARNMDVMMTGYRTIRAVPRYGNV